MERVTQFLSIVGLVLAILYLGMAVYDVIKAKLAPCPCSQRTAAPQQTTQATTPASVATVSSVSSYLS